MTDEPLIRHVSDTARWAAVYRARETERADALFRDPFARRLAGQRGEQIATALFHERHSWSWVTRTWIADRIVSDQVGRGVDLVVNLAAGLDARPYRMSLPASLLWVEVDLPGILDYKDEILRGDTPVCAVERVRLDLADAPARRALFASLGRRATRALVMSEGLLAYLTDDEVATLAEDLSHPPAFQTWATDIMSPGLRRMVQEQTRRQFGEGVPTLKFAPENGPRFFTAHGWQVADVRSTLKTAARLGRLSIGMRLLSLLPEKPERMGSRPWSATVVLTRASPS